MEIDQRETVLVISNCCITALSSPRPSSLNWQICRTSVGPMSALHVSDVSAKRSRCASRAASTRARIAPEGSCHGQKPSSVDKMLDKAEARVAGLRFEPTTFNLTITP